VSCFLFAGSVFTLLRDKTLYIQIIGFVFLGAETGLFIGVLPTAFAFTKRIEFASPGALLACYAFACGAGQIGGERRILNRHSKF
jgi:hypothetical protein